MNTEVVMQALNLMWQGMAGIFIAILVIMASVVIMQKVMGVTKKDKSESE